ncbi:hypothetical protein [Escherichia coli]|uniref:hypothetical protein n=1 Tax=Escherichia coli TaxID=562 RepID=UPI003F8A232B
MEEQIKALVSQIRILETEANSHSHTASERAELFRSAAKVKMELIKLLPQRGQQQEQGNKIPNWSEYFGDNLTQQQREYFKNSLTPEMESYFNCLTDEQRDYFSPDKNIAHFDNAPSAPKQQQPAKAKDDDEAELRRRIYAALGIFY